MTSFPRPSPCRPSAAPEPRKTLREHILHSLPAYTGPYQVGFLEIELPAADPRPFAPHIKRNNEFALKLDTVLFAVYYPADLEAKTGTAGRTRPPWLPRPRPSTCRGYAKFLNIPHWPVTAYMAATTMFTKLPAYRNARISQRWPDEAGHDTGRGSGSGSGSGSGTHQVSDAETLVEQEDEDEDVNDKPRFPVVIFSHGLGGSRTLYSSICGELASYGLVVVAMEHRDGSGARTFVNKAGKSQDLESDDVDKTATPPKNEEKTPQRRQKDAEAKPYYKIDYLFPKDNAQDTSPRNPNGVDKELRGAQIDMRLAEIEEAFRALDLINSGKGSEVRRDNLRKPGNVGSSSMGLEDIEWENWVGRLDLENITIMGHSFGGATAVQALRSGKLPWITQGVLLDPWGPATPECTEQRSVHKPVLSVGSEAFMHWAENYDCVKKVCDEARAAGTLSWMMTIRGSTHLSQTDFAILYPNWMSLLMKTIVNPERAISLTVHSALEFLKLTLPRAQTRFARAWADEQLLSRANPVAKVESDYRPDDKWVAARLKIPNEFSMRLRGVLGWGRWSNGLVSHDVRDEIWCHQSPDKDAVERYKEESWSGWRVGTAGE
ncbi:phospholipase A2 [Parathielavia appendiculata]|uniref:1-alkyl-2-acetylglycerophosphocholine esterase n=1 Tax=Parathielavia appendiculata TaxID=2587402 RepID=A0AAN6U9E1_9PEZI|nr:phospholipase A2 [Parathielavia appendiculata]